jgi:regulatory protein
MNGEADPGGAPGRAATDRCVTAVDLDEDRRTLVVVLDDGTRLEIAPDAEEARGLAPGLRIDAVRWQELARASERKAIARTVFAMLDRRARSRSDLRQRLIARGHAADAVDAVLAQCVEQGLVDDLAFARTWARAQLRRRGVGPRWLRARLRDLGVGSEDVDVVLAELAADGDPVDDAMRALARRRLDLEVESDQRRAVRFLQGRGFTGSTALQALDRMRRTAREEQG